MFARSQPTSVCAMSSRAVCARPATVSRPSQLIDANTGTHVWADRYDRVATDIFAVQDEITENVVASIEPQLYAAENRRFQSKPPESIDAWGYVMRAMPQLWTWGEGKSRRR